MSKINDRKNNYKNNVYKKITMSLLCASFLLMSGCSADQQVQDLYGVELAAPEQGEASAGQETQVQYKTIQAENGDFSRKALANVSLYFPVTADLVCEKENASIREILVKSGQQVKEGDVLISFDVEISNAAIETYSLKLQRCLEAMEKGKTQRQEAILEAETAAESLGGRDLELALLKLEKLKTEYEEFLYVSEYEAAGYREQLAYLEKEKEGYYLTAPFDGVIDTVERLKAGDRVETDQILIKMFDPEQYYLAAQDIAGNLRYNADVTVTAGPKNETKTYTGKVVSAYNMLLSAVPKGDPLIRLDEKPDASELQIAAQYEADIEKLQNVLLIDRDVIRMDEDRSYVRILEGDMIQKRYVLPGLRNLEVVWVLDGLSEEQKVIAE